MKIIIIILLFVLTILYLIYKSKCVENFKLIEEYILPKNIFLFWHELDDKNKIINANINSWRKNIPKDWTIHIITMKNVHDYVDKEFIDKHLDKNIVLFSDFLRLELLRKYGGCHMDAGIIIKDGTFLDTYYDEMIKNKYDETLYEFVEKSTPKGKYYETWFMMAPKESKFVCDCLKELEKAYEKDPLIYKFGTLFPSGLDMTNTIGYGPTCYLLPVAINGYLVNKNKYKLNIKSAIESMFKVQTICGWDKDKIYDYLMNNNLDGFYAVKLTGANRKGIKNDQDYYNKISNI